MTKLYASPDQRHRAVMADDAEPPSPTYGFKVREFQRVNPDPKPAPESARPNHLPLPPLDRRAYDVKELAALAGAGRDQLGTNTPAEARNEVHDALDVNHQRNVAAGLFHVPRTPDLKRRRRWRNYLVAMIATNGFFGSIVLLSGPQNPVAFVSAIAGCAICSSVITWQTWGLRTE